MDETAQIANDAQAEQGWTDTTLLGVLLDYIAGQNDSEAFRAYLASRSA